MVYDHYDAENCDHDANNLSWRFLTVFNELFVNDPSFTTQFTFQFISCADTASHAAITRPHVKRRLLPQHNCQTQDDSYEPWYFMLLAIGRLLCNIAVRQGVSLPHSQRLWTVMKQVVLR